MNVRVTRLANGKFSAVVRHELATGIPAFYVKGADRGGILQVVAEQAVENEAVKAAMKEARKLA